MGNALRHTVSRVLATLVVASGCAAPSDPAPSAHEEQQVTSNARCAGCHAEIAAEWSASQHRSSHDALFVTALSREPNQCFCSGCHAPEAATEAEAAGPLGELGVACTTCHTDVNFGFFGHNLPLKRATLGERCANCHEFDFPGPRTNSEKMQLTASEHRASGFAAEPCPSCHMPAVGSQGRTHRSHAFAEARSETALRAALVVGAERLTPESARITLRSRDVGHAYPTGDLFRRLVVEVEAVGADYAVVASGRRNLARHFVDHAAPGTPLERGVRADDRVAPGRASVLDFELGAAARSHSLLWRVRYERVLHMNSEFEDRATVESSVALASGQLDLLDGTPSAAEGNP